MITWLGNNLNNQLIRSLSILKSRSRYIELRSVNGGTPRGAAFTTEKAATAQPLQTTELYFYHIYIFCIKLLFVFKSIIGLKLFSY